MDRAGAGKRSPSTRFDYWRTSASSKGWHVAQKTRVLILQWLGLKSLDLAQKFGAVGRGRCFGQPSLQGFEALIVVANEALGSLRAQCGLRPLIGTPVGQHIVDRAGQGVRHSHNGSLMFQLGGQVIIASLKLRLLLTRTGPGALIQRGPQVGITFAGAPTVPLAGTLVVAWADPAPGTQMRHTRERRRVRPHFG